MLIPLLGVCWMVDRLSEPRDVGPPRGYVCYRADRPLLLDGSLRDEQWTKAPWTEEFVDIEGDIRPKPRFKTRAKMLWDDKYFYIGAEMDEPHVWATLTEHDSVIFQDNDFEVFIDPDGDNHEYYEFEINALNTGWDLRLVKPYRDGGPALNEWEIPGLKTAVHIRGTLNDPSDKDEGWSVEIALPWKVLAEFANRPSPPNHGDQWRVNFSRVEWLVDIVNGSYKKVPGRPEDNWVWTPQGIIDMHRPERWGFVQFSTKQPGTDAYMPDPMNPAREQLHKIYYAQRRHHDKHGSYAPKVEDLAIGGTKADIELTSSGWIARVTTVDKEGRGARLCIREDSKVWRED